MHGQDEVMTKEDLLAYLKIGKGTLYKLMKAKEIPFIKLDRRVLFRKADIDKWLESKLIK